MSTPTPPNTMPSPEGQRDMFSSSINSGSQSAAWMNIPVWTGRTGVRQGYWDSDQTGSWFVPLKDTDYMPIRQTPSGKFEEEYAEGKWRTADPNKRTPLQDQREMVTAEQMVRSWYTMDNTERARYKDTFVLMGLVNPRTATDQQYFGVWSSYVQQLAMYSAAAGESNKISIGDLIMSDLQQREQSDPGLAELMRTGKRKTTRTSTNIQKSSNLDARALADASARALLGRKATDEESGKLLAALNQLETANPEVTTTTQEEDMYGQILGSSSTTTGGVTAASREQLAREAAEANPEYGAYQASTTYMGALMDMVYGKGY